MRLVFSGLFLPENAVEDERWQCRVCSSWNDARKASFDSSAVASKNQESACEICVRVRHPSWLFVKKRDCQIAFGSPVLLPQSNSTDTICILVAIDFARKEVELLCVNRSVNDPKLDFTERVVNAEAVQELEPLPILEESRWSSAFSEHGMCKDCRRVFHVFQGDLQSKHANQEVLDALLAEVDVLRIQKQHYVKENRHESVLQVTAQLHEKQKQIQTTKRQLEFLAQLFCPYCGWTTAASSP